MYRYTAAPSNKTFPEFEAFSRFFPKEYLGEWVYFIEKP